MHIQNPIKSKITIRGIITSLIAAELIPDYISLKKFKRNKAPYFNKITLILVYET